MTLAADAWDDYAVVVTRGELRFEKTLTGVTTALGRTPFSLTDTAVVRIRHDPAADQIVFDTIAADGVPTPRAAVGREFGIRSLRLHLSAGTTGRATTAPGTVVFDRVSLPTAPRRDAAR